MELIGIYFVACGLLVVAGLAKAIRPDDTTRALVLLVPERVRPKRALPITRHVVRLGASAEVIVGSAALLFPRPVTAACIVASYALFACVVAVATERGGALATCGCFGRPDTPATWLHLLVNAVFALAALVVTLHPPDATSLTVLLGHQPWLGLPLIFASGVGVWLTYLALSPLATLEGARRLVQRSHTETAPS